MYQLGYMSAPSPKAKEAMNSGGIQRWTWRKNENKWKYTWAGATGRVNLECFFIHGTTVENAIQAILDGGLKPTTFETAKDPICGVPGVYFSELPSMDEEDIIRAWHQNKSSGYNLGAVIICKLVGAPLNSDKTGQKTVIEEGMISTKIGSKDVLQLAAHEDCIEYVAAVFNEELLNSCLGKVMERLRGYSPGMHESLKAVKAFLESGTGDKNEPMIALQNVLVNSASTKPEQERAHKPVPLPPPLRPPPPRTVDWCSVPAYVPSPFDTTLLPWWTWAQPYAGACSNSNFQPPPRNEPTVTEPQDTRHQEHTVTPDGRHLMTEIVEGIQKIVEDTQDIHAPLRRRKHKRHQEKEPTEPKDTRHQEIVEDIQKIVEDIQDIHASQAKTQTPPGEGAKGAKRHTAPGAHCGSARRQTGVHKAKTQTPPGEGAKGAKRHTAPGAHCGSARRQREAHKAKTQTPPGEE